MKACPENAALFSSLTHFFSSTVFISLFNLLYPFYFCFNNNKLEKIAASFDNTRSHFVTQMQKLIYMSYNAVQNIMHNIKMLNVLVWESNFIVSNEGKSSKSPFLQLMWCTAFIYVFITVWEAHYSRVTRWPCGNIWPDAAKTSQGVICHLQVSCAEFQSYSISVTSSTHTHTFKYVLHFKKHILFPPYTVFI